MAGDPVSVRDLTNEELLDVMIGDHQCNLDECFVDCRAAAELRRRLQAGEQAVNEINRLADGIAALEWASIDPASETVVDSALRLLQADEEAERERNRLASEYQSYREASNLEGARDAAEIARLTEQVAEPWTDAVLVEKVAQGLRVLVQDVWKCWSRGDYMDDPDADYARRVLGEPS